ncbi:MAG TPA: hypothetical protein PKD55_26050 [Bellilinea sp.]|nr:hypothetical protein [Bellilinea sp.]
MAAALESEMVASLAAVCGLVLAAVWARGMLRHTPQLLGFLRLGSASLLAIMSLGWLVAQFFNFTALDQSMTVALVRDVGTSLAAYSMAVAYALVFAAVLGLLGGLKPFRTLEARALTGILAARSIRSNRLHALIMLICILEIALILTGVISYRTYAIEGFDEGRIAWYLPLLEFMFAAQIALNALAISQLTGPLSSRRASIAVIAVSVLLILFINFTRGRASFVFCALLHLYWVILFIGRIPNKKTLILVALAALPIIYTGSLLNNFMRSGAVQGLDVKVIGSSAFFREALQLWRDDESLQAAEKSRSAYNLASRPLVASPLAKCIALPAEQKNFLLGENLFNSAVWALPRAIFPDKTRYPIQEDLLYSSFPVGTEDTADSPYLYAYADFGYVGIIIYPALLAGFWMAILLLARLPYISSLGIIVIMAVWIPFFTLNLGEAAMVGWFVGLRNTVLALPFIFFIGKLFRSPGAPANQSK